MCLTDAEIHTKEASVVGEYWNVSRDSHDGHDTKLPVMTSDSVITEARMGKF